MTRVAKAWRALEHEQRLAALAALGLFASMFLPWYSKTDTLVVRGTVHATETSLSAFQAFSLVEAAVLLVSASVLAMLFARAERRPFQLPGGDGLIVVVAGGWSALLIFYRLIDKPGLQGNDRVTATVGVEWGIFVALLLALAVAYAGTRMRALEAPGPPARRSHERSQPAAPRPSAGAERSAATHEPPGADFHDPSQARTTVIARRAQPPAQLRPRYPPAPTGAAAPPPGEQLSFEDQPPGARA